MRRIFLLSLVICSLALGSCVENSEYSEFSIDRWADTSKTEMIESEFIDLSYWRFPDVVDDVAEDISGEFSLSIKEQPETDAVSFVAVITEPNGKSFVSHVALYLLEKKNEDGEWELLDYTEDFFKQNDGMWQDTELKRRPDGDGSKMVSELVIKASYHGYKTFPSGEYRLTRKIAYSVSHESISQTLTCEFTISE